jgi:hypothetical protein
MVPVNHDRGDPSVVTFLSGQLDEVNRNMRKLGERSAELAEGQKRQWQELVHVRAAVENVSKLHLECQARTGFARVADAGERLARLEAKISKAPGSPLTSTNMEQDADLVVTVKNRGLWAKILPWVVAATVLGAAGVKWLMGAIGGQP